MPHTTSHHDVTRLIQAAGTSDRAAADRLLALVYDQLRKIAQQRMGEERADHTLQATALVHEAYLRLVGDTEVHWQGRAHFFAAAAEAMRRILVEHARARGRVKRGGAPESQRRRVPLNVVDLAVEDDPQEILSVDEAICRLERQDAELAHIVRLRFYAGLSEKETAELLGVADRTVRRAWAMARAWLRRELGDTDTG
jgi:RNA polymerase sigma factor (TIGR02999 family)